MTAAPPGASIDGVWQAVADVLAANGLVTALVIVGVVSWLAEVIARGLLGGRVQGSVVAILAGLALAWWGGSVTGGTRGAADIPWLAGLGLLGGAMLRDLAIVATAFGVRPAELAGAGPAGVVGLCAGIVVAFVIGSATAFACGYRDPVAVTTIGAGAATYIVGPVTGTALGATADVIAVSFAAGVVKAILVMVLTPLVARSIGLDNPRAAAVYGGLMGTNSGVVGGLAATDPALVPYGALTATFYTGLGCLVGPSAVHAVVRALLG